MTYRERKERRAERRAEWARKRKAKSEAAFSAVKNLADQIPLGQPILVGHHSERRARRDADRISSNMTKGIEQARGDVLRSLSKKKMYGSPNSNPSPELGADKENHTSWERYYQVSDCSSSLRNDWYSGI